MSRSSRSASKGIDGATCLTTSSMIEAPCRSTATKQWCRSQHTPRPRAPAMPQARATPAPPRLSPAARGGSVAVARIDAIEHAQISRPVGRAAAAIVLLVLRHRLVADVRRDLDQLATGCLHRELYLRRLQQMLHQDEGLARGPADGEHAVIVHDHGAIVAEIGDQTLTLAEILGDALVGVIADTAVEPHRLLRDHSQPVLEAGNRHA